MIAYLIDTDWMADALKGKGRAIQLLNELVDEGIAVSIVTYAELYEGTVRVPNREARKRELEELMALIDILPIDFEVARLFAEERARLRQRGLLTPDLDMLIAATALRYHMTLISGDQHFERIPTLKRRPGPRA